MTAGQDDDAGSGLHCFRQHVIRERAAGVTRDEQMTRTRTHVRRQPGGWPIAMHTVELAPDQVLVHSPTWIDDDTFTNVEAHGRPAILFAPNHFHNRSLARFRERYPDALAVASAGAVPRLTRMGHRGLAVTSEVPLPAGMRWLLPDGTRSGEAWLAIDAEDGPTWIMCDAFFNEPGPITGLIGTLLRLGRITPGLSLGATFKHLCLNDRTRYLESVRELLARENPRRVLFSHGQPLEGDVASRLDAVLRARLG
jgi:hypothetical protein